MDNAVSSPLRHRSLARVLGGILTAQACVLAGIYLRPLLPGGGGGASSDRSLARLAAWRRSVARPERDPRLGHPAPQLRLTTEAGRPLRLDRDRPAVLVFVGDGGG